MSPKNIFLLLAVAGTLIPYYFLYHYSISDNTNGANLLQQVTSKPVAVFFAWCVIISSLVVWGLILIEGQRLKMKNLWVYFLFSLLVGPSLALPAFLYQREIALEKRVKQFRKGRWMVNPN